MITETLKTEYRKFLKTNLKESYSIEMFEEALLFDIDEVTGQQDGPEYTLELSRTHSQSGNPEAFSFESEIKEVEEDEFEVTYFYNMADEC